MGSIIFVILRYNVILSSIVLYCFYCVLTLGCPLHSYISTTISVGLQKQNDKIGVSFKHYVTENMS